jgi:acyl dehydratase
MIHRPIRPPERLHSRATFAGVERRKPGAYQLTRIETIDDRGEPVCTSWYGSIYRDVSIEGPDRIPEDAPKALAGNRSAQPLAEATIPVAAGLAHTYTECARIFNPIHTDAAVARNAGLPEIILHGTATLALAVSKIIVTEANGDPLRVRRIGGRFGAMVLMPSNIQLEIIGREHETNGARILFDVLNAQQGPAIRDGFVVLS